MADASVSITSASPLIEISINRPQQRNSLNVETVKQLTAAFASVNTLPHARCILFSGSGTDAFCAGADLAELSAHSAPSERRAFFDSIATLIETIHRCPVPVVGMVYGFALAGGCGLAAACDITLAADDAQFGLPEVALGLAPMVVMAPIVRAIGPKRLSRLVLTGQRIPSAEALAYGLVTEVVAKADLAARTRAICDTIIANGPAALRSAKAAILDVTEREYLPFMHELADRSALVSLSDEASEGIRAFTEKRAPTWRVAPSTTKP